MSTMELMQAASTAFNANKYAEAESFCRRALHEAPCAADTLHLLGVVHSDRGDDFEAARLFEQARFFSPRYAAPYRPLFRHYYATNRTKDLPRLLQDWATADPENPEVQHLMAAITGNNVPSRCSERYIQEHFDQFASAFDRVLKGLDYQGPRLVAEALQKHIPASETRLDVLDAGCGTGLCGATIRHRCRTLVGVDLSEQMVEKASERNCYDELVLDEICALMEARPAKFDAIVSADVLIYFGGLERFMQSARDALRPGGLLVVTTESLPEDAEDKYRLQTSGRYAHRRSYVTDTLAHAGLELVELKDELIRWELRQKTMGHCVVARSAAAA